MFARSPDGPYYLYNMYGSEEQFSNLKYGTKILVTGEKEEWATEIEIADATFEILADDMYMANPVDVTEVGNECLFDYQNECVVFRGLTVGVQENGNAVYYRNDQDKTGHVYFSAVKDGMNVEFKVSCEHENQKKKVYTDVENLQIDDVVDVVCYLYYYNYLPYPEVMAVQLSGSGDIVTDKATLVPVEASSFTPAPTATATPTAKPTVKPTQKPSSSTRFTNKYGTPTTKCAHPGCNNYIASSGDTNCCPAHSNRCAECGKYIDGDALYCLDCIKKAIGN